MDLPEQAVAGLDSCLNKALDIVNQLKVLDNPGEKLISVKVNSLASYQSAVLKILKQKSEQKSLADIESTIFETCQHRTILERIRPLELKLQNKWTTLLKSNKNRTKSANDPMSFGPNLDDINSSDEEKDIVSRNPENSIDDSEIESSDSDVEKSNLEKSKSKKYVPPKINPMPYPGDKESSVNASKKQDQLEKARKRALESSQIRELEEQYGDRPVEYQEDNRSFDNKSKKLLKEQRERQEFEMENYTRVNVSKKQKLKEKKALSKDEFEAITSFGDISMLENAEVIDFLDRGKKNKRRGKRGGKSDLIFGKKKRRR